MSDPVNCLGLFHSCDEGFVTVICENGERCAMIATFPDLFPECVNSNNTTGAMEMIAPHA